MPVPSGSNDMHENDTGRCGHVWVSNSGRGKAAEFEEDLCQPRAPTMQARCLDCGTYKMFTPWQWAALTDDRRCEDTLP